MNTSPDLPYPDATELANHWWWRPGWQPGTHWYSWHITPQDHPAIAELAAHYQAHLAGHPALDLIPARWLHLTVQGIGDVTQVGDATRDAIVQAVRQRLCDVTVRPVQFHLPVLHREAVVLPATDPTWLTQLRHAIRAGIGDILGSDAVPESSDGFRPHISIAYVNQDTPAGDIRHRLSAASPAPATVKFQHVDLIDVNRDSRMYQWRTVARAALHPENK